MKGKITEAISKNGTNPNYYKILGEDGKSYFAHIGDLDKNEKLLYEHEKDGQTEILQKDYEVEFEPALDMPKAIHVKKTSHTGV